MPVGCKPRIGLRAGVTPMWRTDLARVVCRRDANVEDGPGSRCVSARRRCGDGRGSRCVSARRRCADDVGRAILRRDAAAGRSNSGQSSARRRHGEGRRWAGQACCGGQRREWQWVVEVVRGQEKRPGWASPAPAAGPVGGAGRDGEGSGVRPAKLTRCVDRVPLVGRSLAQAAPAKGRMPG